MHACLPYFVSCFVLSRARKNRKMSCLELFASLDGGPDIELQVVKLNVQLGAFLYLIFDVGVIAARVESCVDVSSVNRPATVT